MLFFKKKWRALLFGGIAFLALGGVLFFFFNKEDSSLAGIEVDWRFLAKLDYITGEFPEELSRVNGQVVKIPGFMVPLEDNQKKVTEFLLVPTPQACIHAPAPPPNQMVYVKIRKGVDAAFGPIWVHGKLKISTQKSVYGEASYEVEGESIEAY